MVPHFHVLDLSLPLIGDILYDLKSKLSSNQETKSLVKQWLSKLHLPRAKHLLSSHSKMVTVWVSDMWRPFRPVAVSCGMYGVFYIVCRRTRRNRRQWQLNQTYIYTNHNQGNIFDSCCPLLARNLTRLPGGTWSNVRILCLTMDQELFDDKAFLNTPISRTDMVGEIWFELTK